MECATAIHAIYIELFKEYGLNIACKYEKHKYQIDINDIKKLQLDNLCSEICFTGDLIYYNSKLLDLLLDICFELVQNDAINKIIEMYEALNMDNDNLNLRTYNNIIVLVNKNIKKFFVAHYCNADNIESKNIDYMSMLFFRLRKVDERDIEFNDEVDKINVFQSL